MSLCGDVFNHSEVDGSVIFSDPAINIAEVYISTRINQRVLFGAFIARFGFAALLQRMF